LARKEACFPTAIWADASFISLTAHAQRLYLLLLTHRELDAAGMLPLLPRRWSQYAADTTRETVRAALDELTAAGWAAIDEDTEELYLPKFFAYARIGTQPRRVIGALDAIGRCSSARLQALATIDLADAVASCTPRMPRGLRAEILMRDGNRCRACGWQPGDPVPARNGRVVYRGLEIDHIHPRSKGGTDEPANLQVLCTSCNARKGAR